MTKPSSLSAPPSSGPARAACDTAADAPTVPPVRSTTTTACGLMHQPPACGSATPAPAAAAVHRTVGGESACQPARVRLLATGLAALALTVLTGCGLPGGSNASDVSTAQPAPTASAIPSPAAQPDPADAGIPAPAPVAVLQEPDVPDSDPAAAGLGLPDVPAVPALGPLNARFLATLTDRPHPVGQVQEVALRFMDALLVRNWAAAAVELSADTRWKLDDLTVPEVVAVLQDVRRHAGGDALRACTSLQAVTPSVVTLQCGPVLVAVHVEPRVLPGIEIGPDHPQYDEVTGPHLHAYTSRRL